MDQPLALYRRYRPDTFAQVIGQDHVTDPLRAALRHNRVNHAYLFSGPRGCGKTTSARILARTLNCAEGPTDEPCGRCDSCIELATGGPGSVDVIEIDAASHGGVDDARELREQATFQPMRDRYKIYIIDEAHMVTTQGFNALLKIVEEPPEHVRFIFATTEPEKVIGTVRSRTHHYPFRLIPPRVLSAYLSELCEREGVTIEPAALPLVVRAGGGSARDTLSVLDQLIGGASDDGVTYALTAALLGFTPDTLLDEVVDALAGQDAGSVFAAVDKVVEAGQDPRRFTEDLLQRFRDLVIITAVPDASASGLIDVPEDQAERLVAQAARFGSHDLARYAELVAAGLADLKSTTAPRLLLELLCARLLLPGVDDGALGLAARLDRMEKRLSITGAVSTGPEAAHPSPSATPSGPPAPAARPSGPTMAPVQPPSQQVGPPARVTPAPAADGAGPSSEAHPPEAPLPGRTPPGDQPAGRATPPSAPPRAAPQEAAPQGSAPQDSAPQDSAPQDSGAPDGPQGASAPPAPARPGAEQLPTSAGMGSAFGAGAAQASPAPPATDAAGAGGLTLTDMRRLWPEVVEAVKAKRRVTWIQLSQHAQVIGLDGRTLTIGFNNAGARESFVKGGSDVLVQQVLIDLVGQEWHVDAINDPAAQPGGAPDVVRRSAVAAPDARADTRSAPAPDGARAGAPSGAGAPDALAPGADQGATSEARGGPGARPGGSGRPDSTRPGWTPDPARAPGGAPGASGDQPPWSDDEPPPPDDDAPPTASAPPPAPRRGRPRPENFEAAAAEPKVDPATQDAAADRDDPTLSAQDTATLLSERLGAQVIEEIPHR
ncbi:DNA polymerase III subunit gamma and tau [Nocardioides sp. HDW12B]|uniref:DNA polymerase III subunit gamma and tau n=1 Tax=Nocardioides sp. HDW12B TaxID=2714939 RepID=UPI001409128D|nr:DNA polymerase III subunit gamma and tau [Nocardioides sp. HDW12B]QIK67668.1 DNA polymerase III subunit gamma and tau [Nocardioides sp. HDW12B]